MKKLDITGEKNWHLTAVKDLGRSRWLCVCDCGAEKEINISYLRSGKAKCCGKCEFDGRRRQPNDLTGKRYGLLTVVGLAKSKKIPSGKNVYFWKCVCDCGNETEVSSAHLISGHTQSCGCLHQKMMDTIGERASTHGRTKGFQKTKSYKTWGYIKRRCYYEKDIDYKYYGARGIKIADCWINNAEAFCEYVESLPRYNEQGTTLDRIDSNGNYEPGNIRWVTMAEQRRNTSRTHLITISGETLCLLDWAKRYNISPDTIYRRMKKFGMDEVTAITMPKQPRVKIAERLKEYERIQTV